ncbi:diacylglycerol kinase [Dietzia sp.]|uniref:diacylglycerol kinase n=1 Tax=Dietzia sp. TaxID=1871616 RepID=UPI002FDA51D5
MTAQVPNANGDGATSASESGQCGTIDVRKVALLTNPAAGKGSAGASAKLARRCLAEHGIEVESIEGDSAEASLELARLAVADSTIDALVACGGDGLIGLALQAQARSNTPLGIIPAGTGNDHAREYGIPTHARRAADVIAKGFFTTTDLGTIRPAGEPEADPYWFGTIACAGFDSRVSDRVNVISWPRGQMRYNLAIVLEFFNFHSIPTRLVLDHETVIDEPMTLVAIGNTKTYGGGMRICPDADHHDGLFDITVLERMNRFRAASKFGKIFSGSFVEEEGVRTYRAAHVRVEMEQGVNGYADGDRWGPLPMDVEVARGAGRYIVPRP